MAYAHRTAEPAYVSKRVIIANYHQLIDEIIEREDAEPYYVNFLFHSLPGKESTKMEIMKREITRFHDLLKRHVVRKSNRPGWRELVPVLIGAPDYPVAKRTKVDGRLLQVNDGLHFNAVVLLPPRFHYPRIPGERQSRLEESLVVHVEEKKAEYLTEKLYRIHVTPMIKHTTMADYTFKALKSGRVSPDEILILK